jgi:hypothetical protein
MCCLRTAKRFFCLRSAIKSFLPAQRNKEFSACAAQ